MTIREKNNWNDQATWIDELPDSLRSKLRRKMITVDAAPHQTIIDSGSKPLGVYEIVTGRVKLAAIKNDGREVAFSIFGKPFTFGETAIVSNKRHVLSAVAVEKSQLRFLKRRYFDELRARHHEVNALILKSSCLRLTTLISAYVDMSVSSLEERLASQLHILASAAGKRETSDEESETYSLFVRQDDLANMLGVARQSINRILKEWEAVGLVKLTYGGLAVTDMPGLLKIAVPPGESGKSEAG